jgi:hypothetical protein
MPFLFNKEVTKGWYHESSETPTKGLFYENLEAPYLQEGVDCLEALRRAGIIRGFRSDTSQRGYYTPDNALKSTGFTLVLQLDFLDIGIECTFSTRNRGGQGCRRVRKFSGGLRKLTRWLG